MNWAAPLCLILDSIDRRCPHSSGKYSNRPQVRQKLVLNVMDGLIAGYAGGPGFKPQYSWNYGALYFSVDPVAVDSLCVEALDTKRREAKVPLIGPRATHIATAGQLGLGQSARANIDLTEVKPPLF